MKAICNAQSKTLYSLLSTGSTKVDRETSRHDCKTVVSDPKHQCKQPKSTQNNKSKLCCSCVRLRVHMFIYSILLGKYIL